MRVPGKISPLPGEGEEEDWGVPTDDRIVYRLTVVTKRRDDIESQGEGPRGEGVCRLISLLSLIPSRIL